MQFNVTIVITEWDGLAQVNEVNSRNSKIEVYKYKVQLVYLVIE